MNNVVIDIKEREIGITLCSETWQKDSNRQFKSNIKSLLEMDGLQFISCPRPSTKRGGGCAIIVNTNQLTVEKLLVLVPYKLEVVWCLVRPRDVNKATRFKEVIACAFYLAPNYRKKLKAHPTHNISDAYILNKISKLWFCLRRRQKQDANTSNC